MKVCYQSASVIAVLAVFVLCSSGDAQAQFTAQWLDIGEYHAAYVESGARHELAPSNIEGMEWPAIRRFAGNIRARALWIGVHDWTDEEGRNWPTFVARIGPRGSGAEILTPIQNKLIGRYEDTNVLVDGALSFDNVAVLDEVDPNIPADRMIDNIVNFRLGITMERKVWAYTNEHHDDYQIIEQVFTNTGNTDDDDTIELPDQTLHDVYFFKIHRWRGNEQEAWITGNAQAWGKFSMPDVVGDGHGTYPVDFTATYMWAGFNPDWTRFNNLGGPLWDQTNQWVAEGDSVGRLTGGNFVGRIVLHADASPTNKTYIQCTPATFASCQPHSIGFMDQDEVLTTDGSPQADYYELGILTRDNPAKNPGCATTPGQPGCFSRMFPHYADRIEPSGNFWKPTNNASSGKQGGHANTVAYGPYEMAPGESVRIVVAESVGGFSQEASYAIGRAYKRGGATRETRLIEFDANGDGVIDHTPFNHNTVFNGSEAMTKNQWVISNRDSLFKNFLRARDLFEASNDMTRYPIVEPPRAPIEFTVDGKPDRVELRWTPAPGGPSISAWEIYRTSRFEDNLLQDDGTVGYKLVASLPGSATSFDDTSLNRGTDYFYYIQAVGEPQPKDPRAITGTPSGLPLRSSRYLTQTYQPVSLKRPPGRTLADARVVPNPVNLGSDQTVRFAQEDRVAFFDIPGECTIKIYSELGEFIQEINHTDGSGDEIWNLTTRSRQLLVSGIYIAVIQDSNTGERAFLKFVVIR